MTKNLAQSLRAAWEQAPRGDVVVRIHLFGIENAAALEGISLAGLVEEAGVPKPYATEIHKGMRLAEYVTLRRPTGF